MKVNMAEMFVDDEIKDTAIRVLESKKYVKGQEAKTFEQEFAAFCNAKYGVATNSGTSALHVAMLTVGIKRGDEVIVPSHTFVATVSPLLHIGAKPVFTEINKETYTTDPDEIQKKITNKTKAIVPVHLYGHPCDMDTINELAEEHDLKIIEDACQAHGAEYKGKRVGSIGDMACFSFFPSKNMTVAGDGGMIVTNDEEYAIKARALVNQGRVEGRKYEHDFAGFNYRMSELLAAIGRVQLKHLPEWIEKRRNAARMYNEFLEGENVILPVEKEWAKHVYHLYVIRHERRDELREFLKERSIAAGVHYPMPVHLQPSVRDFTDTVSLPFTEKVAQEVLSIPMHPEMSLEDVRYVADAINEWCKT
ncbi:MAG: DegT/DnrJ/EryC1/StrS family aminotransferase [Candidatus Thermoplasmatota archaeon]|nr:DegT/DnrJ/EryC1/StrS family aminotransferase [Candidatus Thermoplasmatota archaeon]